MPTLRHCLRCVLAVALLCAATQARAVNYTDLWWTPAESGWAVNVVHHADLMLLVISTHGVDRQPTWYVAAVEPAGSGAWSGGRVKSDGPYFGGAFAPPSTAEVVGKATFVPAADGWHAALTYSVGSVTVTKTVERETFSVLPLGGVFGAHFVVTSAPCLPDVVGQDPHAFVLEIATVPATLFSGRVTLVIRFQNGGVATTVGDYRQHGTLFAIDGQVPADAGYAFTFANVQSAGAGLQGDITWHTSECDVLMPFVSQRKP